MPQGDEQSGKTKPNGSGLESYRRLIELQKQMIELSQQHAQARREYESLRASVSREVAEQLRGRQSMSARLRASATRLLKRSPALARRIFS